jgi:hypothetical protein
VLTLFSLQPTLGAHATTGWTSGTVFIADQGHRFQPNGALYSLAPGGSPSLMQTGGITDVNTDAAGNVYFTDCSGGHAYEFQVSGAGTLDLGAFNCPVAIAVDNAGNRLVADFYHLYLVPAAGGTPTVLLNGVAPSSLAVDGAGNVWMADGSNHLAVLLGGIAPLVSIAGTGYDGNLNAVRLDGAGNIFASDAFFNGAVELPVGGGAATTFGTGLAYTQGVATDGAGAVWISDKGSGNIVKVAGSQTTVASGLDAPQGLAIWPPPAAGARGASSITLIGTPASGSTVNTATPVKLQATVAAASGSKVGLVQFSANGQPLANAVMSSSAGVAKLTTPLPAGSDSVTATFLGNAGNYASGSNALSYTVTQLPSHTVLTTPGSTTVPGDTPVSVTATVTGSHGKVPTGYVSFLVNNALAASVSLDSGGVAVGSVNLKPGTDKVTAAYSGDAIFKASNSNAIIFTTTPPYRPSVTTTVTYGPPDGTGAVKATISVTVKGVTGNGAPTGTVTATFNFHCTALTPKTTTVSKARCTLVVPFGFYQSVTINYSGDSTYDPGSTTQTVDNSGG